MGQSARGSERGVVIKTSYACMNIQVRRSNKEVLFGKIRYSCVWAGV